MTHDPFQTPTPYGGNNMPASNGSFVRDTQNKAVAGICSALARRTGWDLNLIRAAVALGAVLTSGTVALIYLVLWAVVPAEGADKTAFSEAMKESRKFYDSQKAKKDAGQPGAEPGPAPRTPRPEGADPDPFNLYKD